jgi:hypothetical protein
MQQRVNRPTGVAGRQKGGISCGKNRLWRLLFAVMSPLIHSEESEVVRINALGVGVGVGGLCFRAGASVGGPDFRTGAGVGGPRFRTGAGVGWPSP